jgi:hypothetical protein
LSTWIDKRVSYSLTIWNGKSFDQTVIDVEAGGFAPDPSSPTGWASHLQATRSD